MIRHNRIVLSKKQGENNEETEQTGEHSAYDYEDEDEE
jgi:hypothetical protein